MWLMPPTRKIQMTDLALGCSWNALGGVPPRRADDAVAGQHRAQRQAGEAHADVGEK